MPGTQRRAAAWNLADWALPPALLLLLAPLLLAWLGAPAFGVWALCLALSGLALVPASALADAGTRAVARNRAAGSGSPTAAVATACVLPAVAIAGLIALALATAAPWISRAMPGLAASDAAALRLALPWTGALVAARSLEVVLGGLLAGLERYDLSARAGIPTSAAVAAAWLLLAGHGLGPWSLIAASAAASAAGATVRAAMLRGLGGRPWPARPSRAELNAIADFAWRAGLQGAGGTLIHQVDRIVLAAIAGPAPLAAYVLCLQLAQNVHVAVSRGAAVLFPRASLLAAQGDSAGLRSAYDRGMRACAIAGAALGAPLVACAHPLLQIWAGGAVADTASTQLALLATVYAALATTAMPYFVLNAIGAAGFNAVMGWLCGIAVVGCALLLVPLSGADGAAWSRFAAIPVGMACQVAIHRRVFGSARPWHVLAAYLPALAACGAAVLVAPWIAGTVHGAWGLAAALAASALAAAAIAWLVAIAALPEARPLPQSGPSPMLDP